MDLERQIKFWPLTGNLGMQIAQSELSCAHFEALSENCVDVGLMGVTYVNI